MTLPLRVVMWIYLSSNNCWWLLKLPLNIHWQPLMATMIINTPHGRKENPTHPKTFFLTMSHPVSLQTILVNWTLAACQSKNTLCRLRNCFTLKCGHCLVRLPVLNCHTWLIPWVGSDFVLAFDEFPESFHILFWNLVDSLSRFRFWFGPWLIPWVGSKFVLAFD